MIIEQLEQDNDKPFVKITFTRKEAEILRDLLTWDIEALSNSRGELLIKTKDANNSFGFPLFSKLNKIL